MPIPDQVLAKWRSNVEECNLRIASSEPDTATAVLEEFGVWMSHEPSMMVAEDPAASPYDVYWLPTGAAIIFEAEFAPPEFWSACSDKFDALVEESSLDLSEISGVRGESQIPRLARDTSCVECVLRVPTPEARTEGVERDERWSPWRKSHWHVAVPASWKTSILQLLGDVQHLEYWVRGFGGPLPESDVARWLENNPRENPRITAFGSNGEAVAQLCWLASDVLCIGTTQTPRFDAVNEVVGALDPAAIETKVESVPGPTRTVPGFQTRNPFE